MLPTTASKPGLSDGIFSNSQFGHILEGFGMENVFISYRHLLQLKAKRKKENIWQPGMPYLLIQHTKTV
jgi:hypothetical protein